MENKQLMLYFHIPFCVSKCAYCAFYSAPCKDETIKDKYAHALINQLSAFNRSGHLVTSAYFGGGTPTVLGCHRLQSILCAAKKHFDISSDAEITVEANPGTVNEDDLRTLKAAGFNRLSLGAQSFNDSTLKLLNRAHTAVEFEECFLTARQVGFNNISADLIFGLPNESMSMLEHSINRLLALKPEHISVYGLSLEEGTPLFMNREQLVIPDEDAEEEQYRTVCRLLGDNGYLHYEISNFAKPGKEARHNTGYWKRVPYLGFGASAHSFFDNKRFSAVCDTMSYIELSSKGLFAPTDYYSVPTLTREEEEDERIMLGLRLKEGVEMPACPLPRRFIDEGFAVYNGGRLSLTEKGFRVSNAIIAMIV